MESTEALVERARNGAVTEEARHVAFAELVRRFEDLAFACACARLRDPALAEDAAQDAFLVAWQRLDQLREPAAFAGWIRRLVLTQCHRRLRGGRLRLAPHEEGQELPGDRDETADAEAADEASLVRHALGLLASGDRLVLILFYGSGRSQAEMAEWLRVPITTIARRIAHAKRRLRRQALDAFAGRLRRERRASGEAFLVEFNARLRRLEPHDADGLAMLARRLGLDRAPRVAPPTLPSAYVIEDPGTGLPIAFASAVQTIFRPIYDLQIAIGDEALRHHAGDVLLTQILQDAIANDAITLQHRTSTRHAALVSFLGARGFQIVERAQDWRLSLPAGGYPFKGSAPEGVDFLPLSELTTRIGLFDQALELLTGVVSEDPDQRVFLPIPPELLQRLLRSQGDGVVALTDGKVDGLVAASDDDLLSGTARINLLVVRRYRRGHGIATAMLRRLLNAHACESARIVSATGPDLSTWLVRRGFTQVADRLLLERILRKTVAVSSDLLNEYAGRYVWDARPESPIVIERRGDSLISKARDMRDVLLASSSAEFFTRHHYGRGRFERDTTGRVSRLVYTEGPHEIVAQRVSD
jgi:RNA polymerase sigma-70 factor (ECF subfamily)